MNHNNPYSGYNNSFLGALQQQQATQQQMEDYARTYANLAQQHSAVCDSPQQSPEEPNLTLLLLED